MKVLIINHFPLEGSGSGIYTKNLAKELKKLGHEVMVIFPELKPYELEGIITDPIYFTADPNVPGEVPFNFPCFTSHPRSNTTFYELSNEQVELYIETLRKHVKEAVERFKPDIIHAQHLWITPYLAMETGIPYVVTAHGTDLKGFVKDERYHAYALPGARKASKIITISQQVEEETKTLYGVDAHKTSLILNGYDSSLFKVKDLNREEVLKRFDLKCDKKYLVSFVGKLAEFKGVDVLLKAARNYNQTLKGEVTTIIAGNGELYQELTRLKNDLGLDCTFFLGHVDQEDLVDLYNVADVSTVPSRVEPFGLVAIEALACGTPVVGTNQGGLPDFITEEVGSLVPVEDDLALADKIVEELTRPDKVERQKKAAKYAYENFSVDQSIKIVEDLYQEILKGGR